MVPLTTDWRCNQLLIDTATYVAAAHNQFAYKAIKTAPLPDLLKRVAMNKLKYLMNTILNYKI